MSIVVQVLCFNIFIYVLSFLLLTCEGSDEGPHLLVRDCLDAETTRGSVEESHLLVWFQLLKLWMADQGIMFSPQYTTLLLDRSTSCITQTRVNHGRWKKLSSALMSGADLG